MITRLQAEHGIATLIEYLGYKLTAEDLAHTPARVVRAFEELTRGVYDDPSVILSKTFDGNHRYDEMIILDGIDYTAVCEHHLLPFQGTATVAYLPAQGGRIVGLSKLARLVDCYARRLTMQERITTQITDALDQHLDTWGSAAILRSRHECMTIRGVHKPDGTMVTSSMTGRFRDRPEARAELLSLTRG